MKPRVTLDANNTGPALAARAHGRGAAQRLHRGWVVAQAVGEAQALHGDKVTVCGCDSQQLVKRTPQLHIGINPHNTANRQISKATKSGVCRRGRTDMLVHTVGVASIQRPQYTP